MPLYVIRWNSGYGDSYDTIEAENEREAMELAYDVWSEDVESHADYEVVCETDDPDAHTKV